jgi:hypothetical protein
MATTPRFWLASVCTSSSILVLTASSGITDRWKVTPVRAWICFMFLTHWSNSSSGTLSSQSSFSSQSLCRSSLNPAVTGVASPRGSNTPATRPVNTLGEGGPQCLLVVASDLFRSPATLGLPQAGRVDMQSMVSASWDHR